MLKHFRKFSTKVDINKITNHNYDAIVIGAGGAGLRATMGLAEKGYIVSLSTITFIHKIHISIFFPFIENIK